MKSWEVKARGVSKSILKDYTANIYEQYSLSIA